MTDPLETTLERTPAWRDGAVRALVQHGPALKKRGKRASPALLLRVAELSLAAGGAGESMKLAQEIARQGLPEALQPRLVFLIQRLAARGPLARLEVRALAGTDPLTRMRQATVRAEAASYLDPNLPERLAGFQAVLAEPQQGSGASFEADELRFLAASSAAQVLLLRGDAPPALPLLEQAAALARRHDATHDEAGLQLWRFLGAQAVKDSDLMLDVAARTKALPTGAIGRLPKALLAQLEAARTATDGDPVASIETLDAGMQQAYDAGDWTGYTGLAHAKFLAFDALQQPYFAYRTLKLARLVLRRNGHDALDGLLAGQEQRLRSRVGDVAWASFGERLMASVGNG